MYNIGDIVDLISGAAFKNGKITNVIADVFGALYTVRWPDGSGSHHYPVELTLSAVASTPTATSTVTLLPPKFAKGDRVDLWPSNWLPPGGLVGGEITDVYPSMTGTHWLYGVKWPNGTYSSGYVSSDLVPASSAGHAIAFKGLDGGAIKLWPLMNSKPVCECGAVAVGSGIHSTWCQAGALA